jgi:hypothetical protein
MKRHAERCAGMAEAYKIRRHRCGAEDFSLVPKAVVASRADSDALLNHSVGVLNAGDVALIPSIQ